MSFRFAVCYHGREGSNLLCHYLNCHPEINMQWELFNPERTESLRKYASGREYLGSFNATGFKVSGWQVERAVENGLPFDDVAPTLKEWGCKLVAIHRLNRLQQFVSYLIAKKTRVWMILEDNRATTETVTIDTTTLLAELDALSDKHTICRRVFAGVECLDVYYETLTREPQQTMNHVFRFLGYSPVHVETKTKKQERRPLTEVIDNYGEVADVLRGTVYENQL